MQVQPLHINETAASRGRKKRHEAQCSEIAERGSVLANDARCVEDVVGAPFPLAGRAGGWVVQDTDFMAISHVKPAA